jgi:hypothetical protein
MPHWQTFPPPSLKPSPSRRRREEGAHGEEAIQEEEEVEAGLPDVELNTCTPYFLFFRIKNRK